MPKILIVEDEAAIRRVLSKILKEEDASYDVFEAEDGRQGLAMVQSQAFDYLDAPIEKINTADTPAPYSPVLLKEWIPNSEDVIKAVKKVLYK